MAKVVLSTVGISLLLNSLERDENEWRQRLNSTANETVLPDDVARKAHELQQTTLATLRAGVVERNRHVSAELNGLYGLYVGQLAQAKGDMHFLVATDTALGRLSAETLQTYLTEQGLTVDVYIPRGLSTAKPLAFSTGIKDLMHWCEAVMPGYRQSGYQVVFNLTGGFKSLQGYLNIVGMFYADSIVYIFETGTELLTIPRLPLQVDVGALREYRVELALMAQGHIYPRELVAGIPTGLLEIDAAGDATLSDWGALIWNRAQQELLGDDLLPFPRLQYTNDFRRDFKEAARQDKVDLQETLAKVANLLEQHHGDTAPLKHDGGLQYENFKNKTAHDGRPIGHFRVTQGRRVSCTAEDGALRLRRYGEHAINDNP